MRHPLRLNSIVYFVVLLGICGGCGEMDSSSRHIDGAGRIGQGGFRFVVAADPQLFRGKKEDLDRGVELINEQQVKFVVMCGDLVETPANQQQIDAYKDSVSKLSGGITLYNLAGNHDLGLPVKVKNVSVYQKNFGQLWYKFRYGDNLFIVLSSDILRDEQAPMHGQQFEWLTDTLEKSRSERVNENIFVFMHHSLYLNSPDEADEYSNIPGEMRSKLLELFVKYQVDAVFSGHMHDNKINNYKGLDLITTNSITVPLGKVPAGFRVVEITGGKYKQQYFTLEELEKKGSVK